MSFNSCSQTFFLKYWLINCEQNLQRKSLLLMNQCLDILQEVAVQLDTDCSWLTERKRSLQMRESFETGPSWDHRLTCAAKRSRQRPAVLSVASVSSVNPANQWQQPSHENTNYCWNYTSFQALLQFQVWNFTSQGILSVKLWWNHQTPVWLQGVSRTERKRR